MNPRAHLRLTYESNPIAFLVTQAGTALFNSQKRPVNTFHMSVKRDVYSSPQRRVNESTGTSTSDIRIEPHCFSCHASWYRRTCQKRPNNTLCILVKRDVYSSQKRCLNQAMRSTADIRIEPHCFSCHASRYRTCQKRCIYYPKRDV